MVSPRHNQGCGLVHVNTRDQVIIISVPVPCSSVVLEDRNGAYYPACVQAVTRSRVHTFVLVPSTQGTAARCERGVFWRLLDCCICVSVENKAAHASPSAPIPRRRGPTDLHPTRPQLSRAGLVEHAG